LQDEIGGLQVWDSDKERWVDVPPNKDAYVFNVGDMLQMWTGGLYKSILHRVVNKGTKDRYSVPFFFDGNVECVLRPLDGSGEGERHLTSREHMKKRFGRVYEKGKETVKG
jgi:isopenicillin N synthase-like dioxygenase